MKWQQDPEKLKASIEKRKKTMLEKYGDIVSPKHKESIKKRASEMNKKGKESLLKKYGVTNPSHLPDRNKKVQATLMKKYGVLSPASIPENLLKKNNQRIKRFIDMAPASIKFLELNAPDEETLKNFPTANKIIKFECKNCNLIEELPTETYKFRNINFGTCCAKCSNVGSNISRSEKEVLDYIKSFNLETIENSRNIISPLELDIFIPKLNLAIEYCGLFWHNDLRLSKEYHYNKMINCREKGIRLITIFEDEWINKKDIVKSKLKHLLNQNKEKIYARKCEIKEINKKESNPFIEQNHIQGDCNSSIKLGLFYENKLVSVMTFSKPSLAKGKRMEEGLWELARYCSSKNIVGGASKLLNYFEKKYTPKQIYSYADLRWSQGNLYYKLGFILEKETALNYWYIEGDKRIHRFILRKNKNDDPNLTEIENRRNQGYKRIWDCGNLKFIKNYFCTLDR